MKLSLVSRLVLLVLAITLMATAILALIVHRTTSLEFVTSVREELLQAVDPEVQNALSEVIEGLYNDGGAKSIIDAVQQPDLLNTFADTPFIVIDSKLAIMATTEPPFEKSKVERIEEGGLRITSNRRVDGRAYDIKLTSLSPRPLHSASGELFGELILLPEPIDQKRGNEFALSIWKDAAPWLLAVLLLAATSTAWVMRHALRPIDCLTRAVSQLKEGEFPEEVELKGGGTEFDKLIATFNGATQALSQTDRIRRQLISDIAHELRTPVTNIKGQLEAVQQGLIEPDTDFRETLQAETRLLERLVQDFQEIAISDAGQLRLTLQPLPLRETVGNIVGAMALQANAELINKIPEHFTIIADEERLRQILTNLFDNARREKPHGLRIEISAVIVDSQIAMRFEDNGPGIAELDQPHIFERFYRAEKSRNRSTGGAGLGLTIVKGLVTAMNGSITYEPAQSNGAAFIVSLPTASTK